MTQLRYDAVALDSACERLGLRLAVLFGSRATGSPPPTVGSDLDVAVLARAHGPRESVWAYYAELSEVFADHALDLVLLNEADPVLRYEVMRGGTLLYGDLDCFLEYRAYAYRDFVDSADLRRLEGVLFRKKLAYLRKELHGAS